MVLKFNSKDGGIFKYFVIRNFERFREKKRGEIKCFIVKNVNEIFKFICRVLFNWFYCFKVIWDIF